MASVTPGALMKLLKSMNSGAPVGAGSGGDHRSPVLQVTGIAPATSDLWPSPAGFYLQLSDSVNSTYVFVPDRDPSAAGSLHLGQLLHVDRLLPSHPLPLAPSLKPIPLLGRRSPPPLLGSPQPLSVSSSPDDPSSFLILPDRNPPAPPPAAPAEVPPAAPAPPKRRPASPAVVRRDPSPGSRAKPGSRASSPVPSKCAVPSLVAAKEERRAAGAAKEPAIVVPSRYRNPSPVGGRRAASPVVGRRGSVSPGGRRLSIGGGDGSGGGRKKGGVVVAGIARVSEGSAVKSMRRSWEENSGEGKEKEKGRSKVDQQAILRTQVTKIFCDVNEFRFDDECVEIGKLRFLCKCDI